nr:probable serine/threonine-protein kinase Sps1 [Nerophis lumbriciformis]
MAQNDVEYTLKNGSVIQDTYEILEPIGQGGMGAAYKAKHIAMGHLVAVKVVNQNLTRDTRTLELFKREANLLRELSQSDPENAIVKIETLLQDSEGTYYLIMEYVDGQPLSFYTKRGAKLRDEDLMSFADRMIKALGTIHSKNIIHRDISPDNIMVPNENILQAKILDFGVATDTVLGEKSIIGDTFAGKLGYASPEQMGLFGGEVTGKSDLYSLGLVLLSTAGLKGPGTADMAAAVEARKQDYDLSDSKLSADARALIEGLLKADPKDRHVVGQSAVPVATGLPAAATTDDTMFLEEARPPQATRNQC